MNGYERIKQLYLNNQKQKKDEPLIKIITFLMKTQDMSEKYLNEEKNLDNMVSYINKRAKEQAINNVAIIEDSQVYNWAIEYFDKSDKELGIEKQLQVEVPKSKQDEKTDNNQLKLEI